MIWMLATWMILSIIVIMKVLAMMFQYTLQYMLLQTFIFNKAS